MTKENKKPKAKNPRASAQKRVFDIVPPGKSPAAPNSRSVIVGHKPKVADDQFVKEDKKESSRMAGDPFKKHTGLSAHKKTLAPLASQKEAEEKKDTPKPEKASDSDAKPSAPVMPEGPKAAVAKEQPTPEPPKPAAEVETPQSAPTAPELSTSQYRKLDSSMFKRESEAAGQLITAATTELDMPDGPQTVPKPEVQEAQPTQPAAANTPQAPAQPTTPKTVDDLLAETGPPDLFLKEAIVSQHHHRTSAIQVVLLVLLIIILLAIVYNFLLDFRVIEVDLPYWDLIKG